MDDCEKAFREYWFINDKIDLETSDVKEWYHTFKAGWMAHIKHELNYLEKSTGHSRAKSI